MAFANFPGGLIQIGGPPDRLLNSTSFLGVTMDAANEAFYISGHVITADGGSHTIDTSGSSSLGFRTSSVTFANGSTNVRVGLCAVDTATGPPGRPVNAAGVFTFDVYSDHAGGGGGITANAWQTKVPTSGTKTIANGDHVVFAVQMTARGGSDSMIINSRQAGVNNTGITFVGSYVPSSFSKTAILPNAIITFSDGTLGWFMGSDIFSAHTATAYTSSTSPNEYGQLYELPFPARVLGVAYAGTPAGNYDVKLYSDPLGTPVAERSTSIDYNTIGESGFASLIDRVIFAAPYDVPANTPIVAAVKPTTTSGTTLVRNTIASAAHRAASSYGTSSYAVSRSSGAFANVNSSLDHFYIGLLCMAFDAGGGGGGGRSILVNNPSVVA